MITLEQIKDLRDQTGVSISKCKQALEETNGDIEKSKELLRKWGQDVGAKRQDRSTNNGIIESYIHFNKKLGAVIDLRCESDFVAKSEDFIVLAHDLAIHAAVAYPQYLSDTDIPQTVLDKEKEIYTAEMANSGKPADIIEKIVIGKLEKFKKEVCMLDQPFYKEPDKTVKQIIDGLMGKIGEKIVLNKFFRLEI
jgi:elongation factor Ts